MAIHSTEAAAHVHPMERLSLENGSIISWH